MAAALARLDAALAMSIPDEQTRVFHLQWRAYSLLPTITKDAFMFLLGVGCDGKTTDQLLQLLALAEHAIRIDGNLITRVTGGRKRGGAAPGRGGHAGAPVRVHVGGGRQHVVGRTLLGGGIDVNGANLVGFTWSMLKMVRLANDGVVAGSAGRREEGGTE